MNTNDHTAHVTVHKNPYVCPSWIVSYGTIHIGSAHSIHVANTAAEIAAYYTHHQPAQLSRQLPHQQRAAGSGTRGYREYWNPATPCAQEHLAPAVRGSNLVADTKVEFGWS